MIEHSDSKALIKRVLAGQPAAFDQFFNDYCDRLYRFLLPRLNNDRSAAEEVVQSTLCLAMTRLHQYRGEAALFTWLCAIARRELASWLARNRRYRENVVLVEDSEAIRAALDSRVADPADSPEYQYGRLEKARRIQVALDNLPVRYARALLWKYVQGLSVREIATRLELGQEATQSLLARARRAFADGYSSLAGAGAATGGPIS